ncbi:MAG: carbon-nitrogen hydrolase family protein [Burkholderiales bacterium]
MTAASPLRVACLQTTPGDDIAENLATLLAMSRQAIGGGARFILLPEFATLLHASGRVMRKRSPPEDAHPALPAFKALAVEAEATFLVGSLTVALPGGTLANRSYLVGPDGTTVATYDKLHMFDATLPSGRTIRESSVYRAGTCAVAAPAPFGRVGMTICYDLRFPQLYRALAQAGCTLLVVPSAFTAATGQMHWHALLRARAIENAAYVIAPATCGTHPGEHATFGHSLIVAPSGAVLADGGKEPGIVMADIDLAAAEAARAVLPSLSHDRAFTLVSDHA